MIMRLFHVRAKSGYAAELLEKFSTTSADVVQHEPGNKGYFFGAGVEMDRDIVVFASIWEDMDAIKARFGDNWQVSFLPDGYEGLIEKFWVQHIDVGAGWHVRDGP
ncbi:MAG: antibiotic biosynthesis monooxygenase [Tateyamaria sp.]